MADDLTRDEDLIILDGTTFFFSEPSGDVQATHADGYFFDDVGGQTVAEPQEALEAPTAA